MSWSPEQALNKLRTGLEDVVNKLGKFQKQIIINICTSYGKLLTSYEQGMGKTLTIHEKVIGKLWTSCEQGMDETLTSHHQAMNKTFYNLMSLEK